MFLLKRATTLVLLVTLFGILLPGVYIQYAQGEGVVLAGIETEAQPGAQRDKAEGLRCFACRVCEDNTDLGCSSRCSPRSEYCVFGQVQTRHGFKAAFRGCAPLDYVQQFSCDEFPPDYDVHGEKIRLCSCTTEYCNNQDATSLTSSSTQLLPFWILVAVSVFGLLMIN